ncbi:MAG: hypothetical protein L0Z62_45995 [Gemmataceae bacterium]|nr:hypothetical protein [Gemmataceae bacterium]
MTTAQPPQTSTSHSKSGRRFLVLAVVLIVLFGGLLTGGIYFYQRHAADTALREALAEVDQLDPGWRLQDIDANRAAIPDHENGALHARAVNRQLPRGWDLKVGFYTWDENLQAEVQLNAAQVKALRAELARAGAALAEARKMKDFERGRFFINYADDWISSSSPYQEVRLVAGVLDHDALLRSHEGDPDGALESCRAVLNPLTLPSPPRVGERAG